MYPGSFNPGLEVYNPRVRPNQHQQGPVEVVVNMYLVAVEDIDAEKNVCRKGILLSYISMLLASFQTMKLQITFRQQWVDRRLRFNSSSVNGNTVYTVTEDNKVSPTIFSPDLHAEILQNSVITIQRFVLC